MLHTGFDALEDSIELDCIRRCQARVFPLAEHLGVPVNKIGATMVAWDSEQVFMLHCKGITVIVCVLHEVMHYRFQ